MYLDFSAMNEVAVPHFKGGEGQALIRKLEDKHTKILQLTLPVGSTIGPHVHEDSFEVMYILSGTGVCHEEGEDTAIRPGMTLYCPAGHGHALENDGTEPLVILGIVPNVK